MGANAMRIVNVMRMNMAKAVDNDLSQQEPYCTTSFLVVTIDHPLWSLDSVVCVKFCIIPYICV